MKKLIFILTFIASSLVYAQTTSPSENDEFCPNQIYDFILYSSYEIYSISGTQGAFISQNIQPANNGSAYTYTFKGGFTDTSNIHIFTTNGSAGQHPLMYFRIKTLWGFYKQNNYDLSMTARICDATPIVINLSGQYELPLSSPISYFGSINRYMYTIPAG